MKKTNIFAREIDNTKYYLDASVDEKGNLVIEGYDIGNIVEEFWGDSDYEYWVHVTAEHVSDVLLNLVKQNFDSSSKFMAWLKEKGIPYEFSNWV